MLSASESLRIFLGNQKNGRNGDLLDRVLAYGTDLELQINVSPTGGELVDGTISTYTDGVDKWHSFRIPKASYAEPHWQDFKLRFPIDKHVDAIGSTGWLWGKRTSLWVAFDFDSITGHAEGVGVTDFELSRVREAVSSLDYVEVRRSTGGAGLHLYVFCPPGITTNNHGEHAAVARCILSRMSQDAGFDLSTNVDVCGGNTWIWARRANDENQGFSLLKKATCNFPHELGGWRDHIAVVSRSRPRVSIGIPEKEEDIFEQLACAHHRVPMDETHIVIRDALADMGCSIWVQDHGLLQTHTVLLKRLAELGQIEIRGVFETNSPGSNTNQPNCLGGDTEVITRGGIRPIGQLAGTTQEVMTDFGKWVRVPFLSFGCREVMEITLTNGSRTKTIRATPDHRWCVCKQRYNGKRKINIGSWEEVTTERLETDQVLVVTKPQLKASPSVIGIQHGIVWGDGTCGGERATSEVSLFGEKAQLATYFQGHPSRLTEASIGGVVITNLPRHFKSLVDLSHDRPYLLGWLAGYFATDGCVDKKGNCSINSESEESLLCVRDACSILGIATGEVREIKNSKSSYKPDGHQFTIKLRREDIPQSFFLRDKHIERSNAVGAPQQQYWRIVSVVPAGREEVFCPQVPETERFVLADFIKTFNCFAFPMKDGAFRLFRFGAGTAEHKSWTQDGKNWTTCYYNRRPSLDAAASAGGAKVLAKGGFEFGMLKDAARVIQEDLANDDNLTINVPEKLATRRAVVKKTSNGQIVIEVPKVNDDPDMPEWNSSDKKGYWSQVINTQAEPGGDIAGDYDNILRCLETPNAQPAGWTITKDTGQWTRKAPGSVKTILQSYGHDKPIAEQIMGAAERKPWQLVTIPFATEYPGDRQWNLEAPQFAIQPAPPNDEQESQHPHWDMMLDHIGMSLNKALRELPWGRETGILTGRQYLQAWYANVLRNPFSPLPYLFLYGQENSGKSIFHEAFSVLVTRGVVKADQALTSTFNAELEGCVMAVVEEKDVSKAKGAHEKIKDAVTAENLSIRRMRCDVYQVRNSTHWVQCSNNIEGCPIFTGDSRITVILVPAIEKEIPKERFKKLLEEEAPAFLRTLLSMTLPTPTGRLRLPIVITDEKVAIIAGNRNAVEVFVDEYCERDTSYEMLYADFFDGLQVIASGTEVSRQAVSRQLAGMKGITIRAGVGNKRFIHGLRLKAATK